MPELPEVETVRRVLETEIIGLTIKNVEVFYPKMITNIEAFTEYIPNSKITRIERYGKYLVFVLDNGYDLVSHLRMEGKYFYLEALDPSFKHVHVIFHFDNNMELCYQDTRCFGRMQLVKQEELFSNEALGELAPEPFSNLMTAEYLFNKLKRVTVAIKTALLNQRIMAGLGNIYVDEVLFSARINPLRKGNSITISECGEIIKASKEILEKAILYKGTTIRSYTSSLGVKGGYQDFLNVHTKEICPICGTKLEKKKINGRTSYFCLECQK